MLHAAVPFVQSTSPIHQVAISDVLWSHTLRGEVQARHCNQCQFAEPKYSRAAISVALIRNPFNFFYLEKLNGSASRRLIKQWPLRIDLAYLSDGHPSFNTKAQSSGFYLPALLFCLIARTTLSNVLPLVVGVCLLAH